MRALALVALVACGSSHHGGDAASGGDGAPGDGSNAGADASIDAPFVKGTVHVTVTNAGSTAASCMPGVHVVFIDVDSTTTDVTADGSGAAQADVFPGASVTAVCARTSGNYSVVTVQDVEPGDNLVLNAAAFFSGTQVADTTSAGTFSISYPAAGGATSYTIYEPCGNVVTSQTTGVALPMKAGCVQPTMDLVVVAGNNTGPTAWAEAANVPFANNGSVTVSGAWHPLAQVTSTFTSAPALCSDTQNPDYPCTVQMNRYVPELHGFREMPAQSTSITTSAMFATTSVAATSAIVQTELTNNGPAYQILTDVVDGTAATYSIDFAAKLLPWMCLGQPQCPAFSGSAAKLTIPVTGTGSYDLFETDVTYSRGPAFTQIFVWRVFGPTAGDFVFPTLPASVAVVRPTSTDRQSVTHARICESDALNGWRAARQNPFDSLATCLQSPDPTARRYPGAHDRLSASQ